MDYTDYVVKLTITSTNKCPNNDDTTVTVYQNPTVAINSLNDYVTNLSPQADFVAIKEVSDDYTSGVQWDWNYGDGTPTETISGKPSTSHEFTKPGTYNVCVKVHTQYGCIDSSCMYLTRQEVTTVWIPDAFTPNGDGHNEVFTPIITNSTEYEMLIYDRWGNMVYRTDDLNKGWDGKANNGAEKTQQDVYIYRITVSDFRGKKMPPYIGSVTLLR
jgi:gliding motility-associated-like protein